MTVNQILDLARDSTGTTAEQIPNTTAIVWANIVYRKMIREIITEISENYFVTTTDIDAVAGTVSYDLPTGFLKLRGVRYKATNSSPNYTQSTEIDFNQQPETIEWFQEYQPAGYPRHQIIGNKLFIAPVFTTEAIEGVANNNMLQLDCEIRPADLAVDGAETTVTIPVDYHYIIAIGVTEYILMYLRKLNEAQAALTKYVFELDQMIDNIDERDTTKNTLKRPSETSLE